MSKTPRIFVACAVGAFIGSTIAIQMYQMLWWVGAAIGAFVAYLGYNIEEVIAAIPVAYRRTINWRPDHEWWCAYRRCIASVSNGVANTYIGVGIAVSSAMLWTGGFALLKQVGPILGLMLFFTYLASVLLASFFSLGDTTEMLNKKTMPSANPLKFWFQIAPHGIFRGLAWSVENFPKGIATSIIVVIAVALVAKNFIIEFFRLIHSELRLLCAVDAALGTAVGYFTGNPLIGAVAGGLLGVVNYEIITVRVMKLVGAKSMFR